MSYPSAFSKEPCACGARKTRRSKTCKACYLANATLHERKEIKPITAPDHLKPYLEKIHAKEVRA